MEYVQERIATLHDFGGADPEAPLDRTAVVVPMMGREHAGLAAERVFSTLADVSPAHTYVALRADRSRAASVASWLDSFDLDATVCWCDAPAVEEYLATFDLDDAAGKGRDVWLALGLAAAHQYVVVHDADATSYERTHVPRLVAPLADDFAFVKGYYARVEEGGLYGRLFRLFVRPLLRALSDVVDEPTPILEYLLAFRYALAGEFAATSDLVRSLRVQPGWGLEIGTLGDAFDVAGFEHTAQVDLGIHRHDHRAVGGDQGLGDMSEAVADALFRVLADYDVSVDLDGVRERYEVTAADAIERYAADAAFNDLPYDREAEGRQVETYAEAVGPPDADRRLPPWAETDVDPGRIRALATDIE